MTEGPNWQQAGELLAGPTTHQPVAGERADLVLLDDGRIGYATHTTFTPVGADADLERITVNTGRARGTCVLSLLFADGEVRETVQESGAVVGKRLREAGYAVSAQMLTKAGPPPAEQPLEHLDGTDEPDNEGAPAAGTDADEEVAAPTMAPVVAVRSDRPPAEPAAEPDSAERKRRFRPSPALAARVAGFLSRGTISLLRLAVLLVGGVVVAILVIYVLLVLTKANPSNDLVRFFARVSRPLAWKFKDLFTPRTVRANITENYGIAAIVYLIVTVAVARVLARFGGVRRPE